MLKEVMAENRGLVSYIPSSTYFTKRVHIKCRGCPTLWGCSMVHIGKNIANCSKTPQFLPAYARCARAVRVLCRQAPMGRIVCCARYAQSLHRNVLKLDSSAEYSNI